MLSPAKNKAEILPVLVMEQQEEQATSTVQTIQCHEKMDELLEWHNHQDPHQAFYLD
jgi:hypothetical protein